MCVLVTQLCPILCDPMDCSPPGFSLHRILQARILEWVAIPFSRGSSRPGMEPESPELQADSLTSEPPEKWTMQWPFSSSASCCHTACSSSRTVSSPQVNPVIIKQSLPTPPRPQPLATVNLLSVSTELPFQVCHTHSITQHVTFGEWLPSLSIMLRSMRVVAGIDPSFLLWLTNNSGIFIKVNTCSIKIAGVKEEAPASAKCKGVTLNLGFLVYKSSDNHSNQTHLAEWLGDKRRYLYIIIHFPNAKTCNY